MVNGCCRLERQLWKTRTHNVNYVSITLRMNVIAHDNVLIVLEDLLVFSLFFRN